ncbi:MAG TPA: hypothetical protein VF453_16615 [Burkholderiaceae bacterium]
MIPQIAFFASVGFGLVAWSVLAALFAWPRLCDRPRADALRPLLVIHAFRFVGLSFLVPGVVGADLPQAFARGAAGGDLVAAVLALLALATQRRRIGTPLAWAWCAWGSVDLVNAFYQAGTNGLRPSQLGAAYYLPTFVVPMLLVTHVLALRILLRPDAAGAPIRPAAARSSS